MKLYKKVLKVIGTLYDDISDCPKEYKTCDDCKDKCYNYKLCFLLEKAQSEATLVDSKVNDYYYD